MPPTFSAKSFSSAIILVLAVPFALIGAFMMYLTAQTTVSSFEMQRWNIVNATITRLELENAGIKSKTKRVIVDYSYVVDGRSYSGNKASLYSSDNIGSFHEDLFNEIESYRSQGAPYPVYVNPDNPSESILNPKFRWEMLGFFMIFVVVFGGVGFGLIALYFINRQKSRQTEELERQFPGQPWKWRAEWASQRIRSSQKKSALFYVFFAIFWNAVSFPALFAIPEKLKAGEYAILFVVLFPLAGLFLIYQAVTSVARVRRFGGTLLEMETYPGRPGEPFRARIYAPAPLSEASEVAITMNCKRNYVVRSGKNRSVRSDTLWSNEISAPVISGQSASGDTVVKFEMQLPVQPSSSSGDREWHTWSIYAKASLSGADFEAEFEVPVFSKSSSS